jgi:hypothetical protein
MVANHNPARWAPQRQPRAARQITPNAPGEDGFLGVDAVFRLVPDQALRAVDDLVGDLLAAVRRQAVQEDRVLGRLAHQRSSTW